MVYHVQSGDTHRLGPIEAAAIEELALAAAAPGALVVRVADRLHLESTPELSRKIATLLERLGALGLVEPVDEPGGDPTGAPR